MPATDSPATLPACERAIQAQLRPGDELLVQRRPAGLGPAAARNAAAERAQAPLLVFVDSDVVIAPGALELLRERFASAPELAAVFGAYDAHPADAGAVSVFRNLLHHHVHSSAAGPARTFWAGLGAVRREAFEAVGGFDAEAYPRPSVEDIDLGMRLGDAGFALLLDPLIAGTHLKRWTLRAMLTTDVWRRGVPWLQLELRRGRPGTGLNLGWRHRASAAAALLALLALARRRPLAALASLAALPALNAGLYALLARSGGPRLVGVGLLLHAAHLLAAAASVPIALVRHVLR